MGQHGTAFDARMKNLDHPEVVGHSRPGDVKIAIEIDDL